VRCPLPPPYLHRFSFRVLPSRLPFWPTSLLAPAHEENSLFLFIQLLFVTSLSFFRPLHCELYAMIGIQRPPYFGVIEKGCFFFFRGWRNSPFSSPFSLPVLCVCFPLGFLNLPVFIYNLGLSFTSLMQTPLGQPPFALPIYVWDPILKYSISSYFEILF